jgi:hypothetical protein
MRIEKDKCEDRSVLYRHNLMLDFCGKKCFRSYFDNLIIADK